MKVHPALGPLARIRVLDLPIIGQGHYEHVDHWGLTGQRRGRLRWHQHLWQNCVRTGKLGSPRTARDRATGATTSSVLELLGTPEARVEPLDRRGQLWLVEAEGPEGRDESYCRDLWKMVAGPEPGRVKEAT